MVASQSLTDSTRQITDKTRRQGRVIKYHFLAHFVGHRFSCSYFHLHFYCVGRLLTAKPLIGAAKVSSQCTLLRSGILFTLLRQFLSSNVCTAKPSPTFVFVLVGKGTGTGTGKGKGKGCRRNCAPLINLGTSSTRKHALLSPSAKEKSTTS